MNNTNQIIENYFGGYAAAVARSRVCRGRIKALYAYGYVCKLYR